MSISLQRASASSRWWTIRTRCGYHESSAETLLSNNDVFHNCSFRSPLQDKRGQSKPTVVVIGHSSLLGSQCAIGKLALIHNIYTCSIVHRSSRSSIWNKKWARMGRFIQICPTKSAKDNLQKTLYSANSKAPASRGSFALRGPRPMTRPCECPRYPSDLPPTAYHVNADVPWKRKAWVCLCSEITFPKTLRITSGSTASAKSCLFAQIRIGRSSRSVLAAKSPAHQPHKNVMIRSSSFTSLKRSGSLLSTRKITPWQSL